MNKKVNTKYFKDLIADRHLSQRQLAARIRMANGRAMDPAAMSLMLRGQRRMTIDEAAQIASALGVALDAVIENAGIKVDHRLDEAHSVPVVGWADNAGVVHEGASRGPRHVVAPPVELDGVEAVRVQTTLGVLDALDGGTIYYHDTNRVPEEALGRWCVVSMPNRGRAVRLIKRSYNRGVYTLVSVTGETTENVQLDSAAPVLWLKLA